MKARSLRGQHDFLGVLDQPVVLGVEDVVDGGQADVLVGAAVAGDEVGVKQFVVVDRRIVAGVGQADFDVAVGDAVRDRVMGDVGEEGGVDADRGGNADRRGRGAGDDDVVRRVRNAVGADAGDDLREARGVGDEIAVRIGAQQRHRADVLVGQEDAKHLGLLLDLAPGGHAARAAGSPPPFDQLAGGVRDAVGVERILAQEHLVGGVRGIGLVLVDERSRGVDRADVVGRAEYVRQRPGETVARVSTMKLVGLPAHVQRIVRLQRDEHRAAAALVDEIETVIEELAEQREPGIERGRQADVRRDVGDLDVVAVHREAERLEGRIADHAGGFQIGEREGVRRRRGGQRRRARPVRRGWEG